MVSTILSFKLFSVNLYGQVRDQFSPMMPNNALELLDRMLALDPSKVLAEMLNDL